MCFPPHQITHSRSARPPGYWSGLQCHRNDCRMTSVYIFSLNASFAAVVIVESRAGVEKGSVGRRIILPYFGWQLASAVIQPWAVYQERFKWSIGWLTCRIYFVWWGRRMKQIERIIKCLIKCKQSYLNQIKSYNLLTWLIRSIETKNKKAKKTKWTSYLLTETTKPYNSSFKNWKK